MRDRPVVSGGDLWHVANMEELHRSIRLLYAGRSQRAQRFRYALIIFDLLTIIYFIATASLLTTPALAALNIALGVLILLDLGARLWISEDRRQEIMRIYTLADLVVVASLLLAPFLAANLAFLARPAWPATNSRLPLAA